MPDPISLRTGDLLWQEVDDEIVVLDLRSSKYLRLNGSGAALWSLLESMKSRDELVAALVARYGIDEAQAAADVDAFIDKLAEKQLLA